jgi:hypothetical protein
MRKYEDKLDASKWTFIYSVTLNGFGALPRALEE